MAMLNNKMVFLWDPFSKSLRKAEEFAQQWIPSTQPMMIGMPQQVMQPQSIPVAQAVVVQSPQTPQQEAMNLA